MVGFVLALMLPGCATFLWACRCIGGPANDQATFGLRASLAVGLSLGLSAATYFLWLLVCGSPGVAYRGVELVGWAILIIVGLLLLPRLAQTTTGGVLSAERVPTRALKSTLGIVVGIATATTVCESLVEPYGDWNAWAVWNVRARFLFLGGEEWQRAFSPELRHPDYPLLVPAAIARVWTYLKTDDAWVSWLIGNLFTWSAVTLAACAVWKRKGSTLGVFTALVLAGNVAFVHSGGVQQYADVPLAFFMLAAVVLLTLHDSESSPRQESLCLAGIFAGLAAWTKNEGVLFVIALLAARAFAFSWQRRSRGLGRDFLILLAGLAPALTVLALQKSLLASENKMVTGQGFAATLARIFDASRHWEILQAFAVTAWKVARGFFVILPIVAWLLGRSRLALTRTTGFHTAWLTVCLMLLGYYCTYLITPYDLTWHLRTSLNRLLLQLWPSAVFVFFLTVAAPEEIVPRKAKSTAEPRNDESQWIETDETDLQPAHVLPV